MVTLSTVSTTLKDTKSTLDETKVTLGQVQELLTSLETKLELLERHTASRAGQEAEEWAICAVRSLLRQRGWHLAPAHPRRHAPTPPAGPGTPPHPRGRAYGTTTRYSAPSPSETR